MPNAKPRPVTGPDGDNPIRDEQIREERRRRPELLDALMVAIYSADPELRALARAEFAAAYNARMGKEYR